MPYIDMNRFNPNGSQYSMNNDGNLNPMNSSWYYGATDDSTNDIITHWFAPGREQEKQFMQQMFQIDYQNAYNDPAADMERKKRAGINANIAAAGIAGSPNTSANPSSVPQTPQGASLSDVANVANALTGGTASLADAAFKIGTLNPTVQNLTADYEKKLAELGLTNEQISAWKVDNKYREQNAISDLLTKSLNQENLRQQYKVQESTYQLQMQQCDNLIKELEVMAADINNKEAQKQYYDALAQKTSLEAQWQQTRKEFWKSNGFDIMASTVDAILVQKLENGQNIDSLTQSLAKYSGDVSYENYRNQYKADEETIYNRKRQEYTAEAMYKRASNPYELAQRAASIGIAYAPTTDVKAFRRILENNIESLWNMIEKTDDEEKKNTYFSILQEFTVLQGMSNKELKKYLKEQNNAK